MIEGRYAFPNNMQFTYHEAYGRWVPVVPGAMMVPTTGCPAYIPSGPDVIAIVPITENSVHVLGSSDMVVDAVSSAGAGVPMQETPPITAPPTENVGIPSGDQMDILTKDGTAEGPK
jgi:hypothetical protein